MHVPAGAPQGARRRAADRRQPSRRAAPRLDPRCSRSSARAPRAARRPRRWCSCRLLSKLLRDPGDRQARRADRSRRGAHVRDGVAVPPGRHLFARRPAIRAGRHGHAALLQGIDRRPDSRRRDHRSRFAVVVHRRRHGVLHPRRQHDPVLHLLFDVRLPARRRPYLGGRRFAHAAASCSAAPPAGRRSPAKDCSTRTATASLLAYPVPNCSPTIRRLPTSWRRSSRTASGACTSSRRASSTT